MKRKILAVLVCVALAVCTVMPVISYLEIMQTGLGNGSANRWNEDVKELSDSICKDLKSDEDKVKALYNWIIEHIEYDYDYQEIYQHFNVSKTLSTRKGLCFDYANLFVVFCRSQDIPCFVVDGYSRSDSLAKHTWNRVFLFLSFEHHGHCKGSDNKNAKYPLADAEIPSDYQYGISNEVVKGKLSEVSVKEGKLLLISHK